MTCTEESGCHGMQSCQSQHWNLHKRTQQLSATTGVHIYYVNRVNLSTYGGRAFAYAGPTSWNSLPDSLKNVKSFPSNFQTSS